MNRAISVIIPCYNAARFLSDTIQSVLEQSFSDYEIILIDDGSTDNTQEVIRSFGTRVRAEFGPNRGVSAARNRGTELAQGEFIQYLDADDLLTLDALGRRLSALRQTGADVAYSDWQKLNETAARTFERGEIIARTIESIHPDIEISLFTDFWCPPAALLYRRSIIERIGKWNESLPVIQDARFLLDAALRGGRFAHVPEIGAYYRVHAGQSLSRRNPTAFVKDCFENALQVEAWWRNSGNFGDMQKSALLKILAYVSRASFESDQATFANAYANIQRLQPGWVPSRPLKLALLSHLIGYRRAEAVALAFRKVKSLGIT